METSTGNVRLSILVLATSILLGCMARAHANNLLNMEVGSWGPYIDFSAPDKGVLTRQVRDAFKVTGTDIALVEVSWKMAEDRIQNAAAFSFGWIKNSERLARWRYSVPICSIRTVLVVRQSNPLQWTRLEQLQGISMGWSRGYSYGEALDSLRPRLQITEMGNDEVALKRLLHGSVDAVPMDALVADTLIAKLFDPGQAQQLLVDRAPQRTIAKSDLHLVCAQSSPTCADTLEQFNKGLRQLRGDIRTPNCGD